jgi:hypothetical protein
LGELGGKHTFRICLDFTQASKDALRRTENFVPQVPLIIHDRDPFIQTFSEGGLSMPEINLGIARNVDGFVVHTSHHEDALREYGGILVDTAIEQKGKASVIYLIGRLCNRHPNEKSM